jgi:poly(A) polymerase
MSDAVLPDVDWRNAESLKRVVAALADDQGGPRIVGGAVRDSLLGLPVTDVDLATMLQPDAVIDRLEAARIKAVPTGLDHGTVTAVADGKNYEITTLRRDVATDGRRATVAFATDWKEDAARRDFTINALYADPATGEVFDYFGGLADLDEGLVRFIGDAGERIAEDHLRILRYFRFLARFGEGAVDAEAIEACAVNANSLMALSRERIASELLKLLALPDPCQSVALMVRHGIFAPFLPELAADAVASLERIWQREQQFQLAPSLPARLVAILIKDGVAVDKAAIRLKLSNKLRAELAARLGQQAPETETVRAIAYRDSLESARDAALLFASEDIIAECIARLNDWQPPFFGIKGGDLIARGITAGPLVAKTLKQVENRWIAEGFPATDRLKIIADQAASEALSAARKS